MSKMIIAAKKLNTGSVKSIYQDENAWWCQTENGLYQWKKDRWIAIL